MPEIHVSVGTLVVLIATVAVIGPGFFFMGRLSSRQIEHEQQLAKIWEKIEHIEKQILEHLLNSGHVDCPIMKRAREQEGGS